MHAPSDSLFPDTPLASGCDRATSSPSDKVTPGASASVGLHAPISTTPIPFTKLRYLAYSCAQHLRWFKLIGESLASGCKSIRKVHKELEKRGGNIPSPSSLCNVPNKIDKLLVASFGRRVNLYLSSNRSGSPVMGLSADGLEALRLTIEFLYELDREQGNAPTI